MTGYAKVSEHTGEAFIKVEAKSLNSKYIDTKMKLPRWFGHLEVQILNIVKEKLDRGKIDINVEVVFDKFFKIPKINHGVLSEIINLLKSIKVEHHISDDIRLEHILQFDNVLRFDEDEMLSNTIDNQTINVVKKCVDELDKMRAFEGKQLLNDILLKLDMLVQVNSRISLLKIKAVDELFERIKSRVVQLLNGETDKGRIYQEAAILAEKSDITEEVTRIDSHILHFKKIINDEYPLGKKLDFLCQELYSEFNTIGSKTGNTEIINLVIEGKNIVDQIREQVQNIV
jgi:uncharacterized protein (TIGR00255 family)